MKKSKFKSNKIKAHLGVWTMRPQDFGPLVREKIIVQTTLEDFME